MSLRLKIENTCSFPMCFDLIILEKMRIYHLSTTKLNTGQITSICLPVIWLDQSGLANLPKIVNTGQTILLGSGQYRSGHVNTGNLYIRSIVHHL